MTHGFENKVIIITGAGKGLGRAYALYLANLGARIVVNNRRHPGEEVSSADEVVAKIRAQGGTAIAEYSDVEDPDAGSRLLEVSLQTFGHLDALVANAGISEGRSFHKQNLEDFRRVCEINLMGTVNVLHPAFRHMYKQGRGSLVISSSVAGLYGEHGLPAYSSSKAALLGLMYSLSHEGRSHGLRINAIAPFAATQMTEKDLTPALRDQMQAGRVAPVLAWLISDDCSLNGETVIAGGGKMARARIMESVAIDLPPRDEYDPDMMQHLWRQLITQPLDQAYSSALEQFGAFFIDAKNPGR